MSILCLLKGHHLFHLQIFDLDGLDHTSLVCWLGSKAQLSLLWWLLGLRFALLLPLQQLWSLFGSRVCQIDANSLNGRRFAGFRHLSFSFEPVFGSLDFRFHKGGVESTFIKSDQPASVELLLMLLNSFQLEKLECIIGSGKSRKCGIFGKMVGLVQSFSLFEVFSFLLEEHSY